VDPQASARYHLAPVLSGGDGGPDRNAPEVWYRFVSAYQRAALRTELGIDPLGSMPLRQ
jgi:hypothetical protein